MGFMLNVDDSIKLGVDTIQTVDFAIDTPKDSDARTTDVSVTMTITGKVLTMVDLALWSMISAETADCYKKVTVSVTAAGQVVREYSLPNAFVVDYSETYGDTEGVGTFKLIIRQKKNAINSTAVNGGYAS